MLRQTPMEFHRYLYDEINWDNRLIGILGPRGVGKSTLILQHIKALDAPRTHIFITAESLWFQSVTKEKSQLILIEIFFFLMQYFDGPCV